MKDTEITKNLIKQEVVEIMKVRFISRQELRALIGAESDAAARMWLSEEIKKEYPVISSAHLRGYKIATSAEDLALAKACSRENHRKAWTLHRNTNVLDKWIIREECRGAVPGVIPFSEEIEQSNRFHY